MRNETAMEAAVATWLEMQDFVVARQVPIKAKRLDVVAYNKSEKVFKVFECKAEDTPRAATAAFRQILDYRRIILNNGNTFVRSTSKKMTMHFGKWMEATDRGQAIRVQFYVVLTDEACGKSGVVSRLLDLKRSYQRLGTNVGVLKFKSNGTCSESVRAKGEKHKVKVGDATPERSQLKGWAAARIEPAS